MVDLDWNDIYSVKDVDEAVALFNFLFLQIVNRHMPWKKIRCWKSQAPWITSEFFSLHDKKEYYCKLFKNCPCMYHLSLKKESITACNKLNISLKRLYLRKTLEKYKLDSKKLWCTIREFWPNSKKTDRKNW